MSPATYYAHLLTYRLHSPLKDLLNLYNCQTDSVERSRSSVSGSHGWENRQHPGFLQSTLELRHGQAQPGRLQHGVPGGPPDPPSAGPPHHFGGVLPLLLLSPCQQLLLLLLLLRGRGIYGEVGDEEEKEFGQHGRPVDLRQDGADDARQGRPGHGVGLLTPGQLVQWRVLRVYSSDWPGLKGG